MRIPGSYEDLIEQARRARTEGRADAAIDLYSRVIDRISSVWPKMTTRDEQLHEHLVVAADELQLVLDWEGDHARAHALCQRMAELDTDNRALWLRRAASERIHAGEVEEGLNELRQLSQEAPDDFWHPLELAVRLLDLGRYDEAAAALDEAAQRAHDDEEQALVHWTRFRLLKDQGQRDAAAQAWEDARRLDPFYKQAVEAVYRMFIGVDDYENALLYLDMEENPLLAGYYRGLIAHYQGDEERAKKAWRDVIRRRPGDFETGWEAWALALFRLDDKETARRFLSELVQHGYATEYSTLVLALVCAAMGDESAAEQNLETSLRIRRQTLGPRALLPAEWWRDFEDLVTDEALREKLRRFFALEGNLTVSQEG